MDPRAVARQIRLLFLYGAFTYPFACVPFLYFHFRDHGISIAEYHWMISLYYVTMVAAEVPTGLWADRHSRRLALIVGPAVLALGFAIFYTQTTFTAFCAGQVVFGVGHAVLSGPPTALLYDTLDREDRAGEFLLLESRVHALRLLGTAASFLLGGLLVHLWHIPAAILVTGVLCLVASATALLLREVRPQGERRSRAILASAARDLRNRDVLWITAYFLLIFFLLRYCFHTYQPFLEEAGATGPLLLGFLFCGLNLVAAPAARLVPLARRRFGQRALLWAMPLLLSGSLIGMAGLVQRGGWVLFFLHQVPFGMHWALVQSFVNQRIASSSRATVLSVMSFTGRLGFAALFPLAGLLHERSGVATTYLVVGTATALATLACMRCGRQVLRRES